MSINHYKIPKTLRALALCVIATMFSTACYDNREAKKVVKDFLEANLKTANYDTEYFSKVDSTFVVSDSMLNVMQNDAHKMDMFKSLNFGTRGNERKLNYIRVRYHIDTDTIRQIFYLDSKLQHVVGIKNDF